MALYIYRCPVCLGNGVALNALGVSPLCLAHAPPLTMDRVPDTERVLLPLDQGGHVCLGCDGTGGPSKSCAGCNGTGIWAGLSHMRQAAVDAGISRASLSPLRVEHLKANGILLPETQHALEWLYRHRATNGMADAFCKVGGRRCIDLVAFARLMREQRA